MQRYVRRFIPPESSDFMRPTAAIAIGTLLSIMRGFRKSMKDVIERVARFWRRSPASEGYSDEEADDSALAPR
jgi:hypothetical protein